MQESMGFTPQALESRPTLNESVHFYVQEFNSLSKDRRYIDSGPLPLATAEILLYWKCFVRWDFEGFNHMVVTIDQIWLDALAEKRKKSAAKAPKASNAPPGRTSRR